MKRLTFTALFSISFILGYGQSIPYTSLHEPFESSCGSGGGLPAYWLVFNGVGTVTAGEWQCTPTDGRPTSTGAPTAGVSCTGVYSSAYHVDTSYLVTPKLNMPYGATDVYFQFDSKVIPILPDLHIFIHDSTPYSADTPGFDVSGLVIPPIGAADSVWVTHEINISGHTGAGPFYIAFRYVSDAASGNILYLDNVNTASSSITLSTKNITPEKLQIGITESSPSRLTLSYVPPEPGPYDLTLYDMLGLALYSGSINAGEGPQVYTINGLNLHDGMYFVKMGNINSFGTAKVMIQ